MSWGSVRLAAASQPPGRRFLSELVGWGFVTTVALLALGGVLAERLRLAEAVVERIPAWLAVMLNASGYSVTRESSPSPLTARRAAGRSVSRVHGSNAVRSTPGVP